MIVNEAMRLERERFIGAAAHQRAPTRRAQARARAAPCDLGYTAPVRRLEDHERDVHDIRRAEDDPSCLPASFKRNEFPARHSYLADVPLGVTHAWVRWDLWTYVIDVTHCIVVAEFYSWRSVEINLEVPLYMKYATGTVAKSSP